MTLLFLACIFLYCCALLYLYFFQTSLVFNAKAILSKEDFSLSDVKHISLHVKGALLDGVYKKSSLKNAPLIFYLGGNADDATRIVLHMKKLEGFDIVAFNYRGYCKSSGVPSQEALYADSLKIYDTFAKEHKIVVMGRSLGTGIATYLASKREVKGVILITPYDSILSIARKQYPYFPISLLLKHSFESAKNLLHVKAPIGLIEVVNDTVVTKYHFDKLRAKVKNLILHVRLENTTHGDVLNHPDFEKSIEKMLGRFLPKEEK